MIFGPISSRRFGLSLGINLLPAQGKWCNYNCIYCECGWNTPFADKPALPAPADIAAALEQRLQTLCEQGAPPDAITFSGNGEPTLHPHFAEIVNAVICLRNKYAGQAKICVLTNATKIGRADVAAALQKIDTAMLKLDAGSDEMLALINQPQFPAGIETLTEAMRGFGSRLVVQTMFLRGEVQGVEVDNSRDSEVQMWLKRLQTLRPSETAIYTIARATPAERLYKIPPLRLRQIAEQVTALGIKAMVY